MKAYMSVQEFSDYLGVTKPSVYKLTQADGFPCVKIGRAIRIKVDEAEKWLSNQ